MENQSSNFTLVSEQGEVVNVMLTPEEAGFGVQESEQFTIPEQLIDADVCKLKHFTSCKTISTFAWKKLGMP